MIALIRRAIEINQKLEDVKSLYREQDEIIAKLKERNFTSVIVDNKWVTLTNNFEKKNVMFKAVAFREYEISVTPYIGVIKSSDLVPIP